MYLRPETIVSDWHAVASFLQHHPLGLLTTAIPFDGQSTIQASHLPFHFLPPSTPPLTRQEAAEAALSTNSIEGTWSASSTNDLGTLRCHLARVNPQAKALLSLSAPQEVLVVFSSPQNSSGYISPSWYAHTKPATAKTVPTWNYTELQVYGTISPVPPQTLSEIVRELSDTHEHRLAATAGKTEVWKVEDAPEAYIRVLERAIVGMEVRISRIGMKCKMSREKVEGDREGVIKGLREVGGEDEAKLADLVEALGPFKKEA